MEIPTPLSVVAADTHSVRPSVTAGTADIYLVSSAATADIYSVLPAATADTYLVPCAVAVGTNWAEKSDTEPLRIVGHATSEIFLYFFLRRCRTLYR